MKILVLSQDRKYIDNLSGLILEKRDLRSYVDLKPKYKYQFFNNGCVIATYNDEEIANLLMEQIINNIRSSANNINNNENILFIEFPKEEYITLDALKEEVAKYGRK